MLINKDIATMMNAQIGHEMAASNQYLQLATYFDGQAYKKLAEFFYKQSEEEREHAMKFLHFLIEAGCEVKIPAVGQPPYNVDSAEKGFEMALGWEQEVTSLIRKMMDKAFETKDYASMDILQWFITEQVEEEASMGEMLEIVRRAGEKNLLMVEAYLTHGS